jgi:hypothetical protein
VDGGVLADRSLVGGRRDTLTVTFKEFIALSAFGPKADVLGTRQELVTSQDKVLIQLESLILAQNERWRQA